MTFNKREIRTRIKVRGTTERPRLTVFKSNKYMSAQIIDDEKRITLVSVNEKQLGKLGELGKDGIGKAKEIGKMIAEKAVKPKAISLPDNFLKSTPFSLDKYFLILFNPLIPTSPKAWV